MARKRSDRSGNSPSPSCSDLKLPPAASDWLTNLIDSRVAEARNDEQAALHWWRLLGQGEQPHERERRYREYVTEQEALGFSKTEAVLAWNKEGQADNPRHDRWGPRCINLRRFLLARCGVDEDRFRQLTFGEVAALLRQEWERMHTGQSDKTPPNLIGSHGVRTVTPESHWSEPKTVSEWAKVFRVTRKVMGGWLKSQKVTNRRLSRQSYQIDAHHIPRRA
jgi:hypothetical protein